MLLGSGRGAHPFRTTRDYDNFLARMDGFVAWVDQAINNLRAGVSKGWCCRAAPVARLLPQLDAIGASRIRGRRHSGNRCSAFRRGRRWPSVVGCSMPTTGSCASKCCRPIAACTTTSPQEYLPVARSTVAWSALPGGDFWYAYLVRYYTASEMTPARRTSWALADVARLRGEVERLQRRARVEWQPARGRASALRDEPGLPAAIAPAVLGGLWPGAGASCTAVAWTFRTPVTTRLEIRAVEPYRAVVAPVVSYRAPSADGQASGRAVRGYAAISRRDRPISRPRSTCSKPCPDATTEATLAQRDAVACRGCAASAQIESFDDGWAAYAATLGRELGVYEEDVFSQFGALSLELARAALIVVDTGLHLHGWSRERAIEYLRAQTAAEPERNRNRRRSLYRPARVALAGPIGATQDRSAATQRRAATRRALRHSTVPRAGRGGRRHAVAQSGSEDRSLDRDAEVGCWPLHSNRRLRELLASTAKSVRCVCATSLRLSGFSRRVNRSLRFIAHYNQIGRFLFLAKRQIREVVAVFSRLLVVPQRHRMHSVGESMVQFAHRPLAWLLVMSLCVAVHGGLDARQRASGRTRTNPRCVNVQRASGRRVALAGEAGHRSHRHAGRHGARRRAAVVRVGRWSDVCTHNGSASSMIEPTN